MQQNPQTHSSDTKTIDGRLLEKMPPLPKREGKDYTDLLRHYEKVTTQYYIYATKHNRLINNIEALKERAP